MTSLRPLRRLAAVATLGASLLGATVGVAAPAAAATPTQVALVVQYPGGAVQTWCVDHTSGMTGANVLAVAGPTYGSGPYAGFVLQIGGKGTTPPTKTDYWAYWTTSGGSLVYSGSGVTSTRPAAGTVEAWHWNQGSDQSAPAAGSYASLCPGGYAADATPSAAAPAPTAAGGAPGAATTPRAGTSSGATGAPTGEGSAGSPAPGTTGAAPSTDPSAGPASSTPTTAGPSTSDTPARTTSVAASDVASTRSTSAGGGAAVGLVVAALAVVGLGVAAVLARRRRVRGD